MNPTPAPDPGDDVHLLWPPGQAPGAADQRAGAWSEHAVAGLGLDELETYVDCVQHLRTLLDREDVQVRSAGFARLRDLLRRQESQPVFQSLAARLPELRRQAAHVVSITVGINLDNQFRPVSAALLSINNRPVTGSRDTLLGRLLGGNGEEDVPRDIARRRGISYELPVCVSQMHFFFPKTQGTTGLAAWGVELPIIKSMLLKKRFGQRCGTHRRRCSTPRDSLAPPIIIS